jgi:hypothetical protein
VGSIVLIGPNSRSEDFSPQGLFENVFWPFVVHSHICPAATCGCAKGCTALACGVAPGGAAGDNCSAGNCGNGLVDIAETAGRISAIAGLAAGKVFGAVRLLEPTVTATAIAAVEIAPKIQGARSLYLSIAD